MQSDLRCVCIFWMLLSYCCADAVAQEQTGVQQELTRNSESSVSFQDLEGQTCLVRPLQSGEVFNDAEFKAWIQSADPDSNPPMAGVTVVGREGIAFQPRYPFRPGKTYVYRLFQGKELIESGKCTFASQEKPATKVLAIYPSAEKIPENNLRFYVQFSGPMQKGDIYRFIEIRETNGPTIELPFLEIEQEFWSRDSTRLTLLLDPGRVKRGLKPREEMGPILVDGKQYELVVKSEWLDANGARLSKPFIKRFKATKMDATQPSPKNWKVTPPKAHSSDVLTIRFASRLDHAMLQRMITIVGPDGKTIPGHVDISNHEKTYSFKPAPDWLTGEYKILVDVDLEDSCGNSIARQFDVDVFEKTEPTKSGETSELKFQVR